MRTLRLSLAVTAILALFGVVGGAMPGLAQTDRDTYVTGTLDCGLAGDMTVEGDGSVSLEPDCLDFYAMSARNQPSEYLALRWAYL